MCVCVFVLSIVLIICTKILHFATKLTDRYHYCHVLSDLLARQKCNAMHGHKQYRSAIRYEDGIMRSCIKTIKNIDTKVKRLMELAGSARDTELEPFFASFLHRYFEPDECRTETTEKDKNNNDLNHGHPKHLDNIENQQKLLEIAQEKRETVRHSFSLFLLQNMRAFEDSLCDDLNTPIALRCFFNILRHADKVLLPLSSSVSPVVDSQQQQQDDKVVAQQLAKKTLQSLAHMDTVLGIMYD